MCLIRTRVHCTVPIKISNYPLSIFLLDPSLKLVVYFRLKLTENGDESITVDCDENKTDDVTQSVAVKEICCGDSPKVSTIQNVEENATSHFNTANEENTLDRSIDPFNETCDSDMNNQGEFMEARDTLPVNLDNNYSEILSRQEQTCGFATSRPLHWVQRVDKYTKTKTKTVAKVSIKCEV